jgi:hypothetical protein
VKTKLSMRQFNRLLVWAREHTIMPSKCRVCKKKFYIIGPGGVIQGPKTIICAECKRKREIDRAYKAGWNAAMKSRRR